MPTCSLPTRLFGTLHLIGYLLGTLASPSLNAKVGALALCRASHFVFACAMLVCGLTSDVATMAASRFVARGSPRAWACSPSFLMVFDATEPEKRSAAGWHLRRHQHGDRRERLLAGRYSTAFDIYGIAQNVAEKIGDKEGVATAWLDIGTVYYFQANYPAALEHYKKARDLFTEVTNHYESAKALSGLALIYKEQRRDTEALAALQQVLREFTSLGDTEEVANTLNMIGSIHYARGNYSAAAAAFLKKQ